MRLFNKKLNQAGFDHVMVLVAFVVVFGLIGAFLLYKSFAATTQVNLKLDADQGMCINNSGGSSAGNHSIILYGCSNTAPNDWVLASVSGGFQLQTTSYDNKKVCIDGSAGVGTSASNRRYVRGNVCSSSSLETWHWSSVTGSPQELQNNGNGGCINDPGGSKASSTALIMFSCAKTASNQTLTNSRWVEVAQASSSGGGGGSSSGNTKEQQALCKQFGYTSSAANGARRCANVLTGLNYITAAGSGYGSWANTTQEECLGELWNQESGWDNLIWNPSGAFGIAQALGHGSGSATSVNVAVDLVASTSHPTETINSYPSYDANKGIALYQVGWGLSYIKSQYSTPCGAWSHELGYHWYAQTVSPAGITIHS